MKESQIHKKIHAAQKRICKLGNFMRGTIQERYIQCGKANCRCKKKGENGHGPYTYIVLTDEDGGTASILIPPAYTREAKRLMKNYELLWDEVQKITRLNMERFAVIKLKQTVSKSKQKKGGGFENKRR